MASRLLLLSGMHRSFSLLLVVGVVVGLGRGAAAQSSEETSSTTVAASLDGHAAGAAMSMPLGEREGQPPLALISGLLVLAIGARGRVALARRGAW